LNSENAGASLHRFRIAKAFEEALAWSKRPKIPSCRICWRAFRAALTSALGSSAQPNLLTAHTCRRVLRHHFSPGEFDPSFLRYLARIHDNAVFDGLRPRVALDPHFHFDFPGESSGGCLH
jgi:hypothetical protein